MGLDQNQLVIAGLLHQDDPNSMTQLGLPIVLYHSWPIIQSFQMSTEKISRDPRSPSSV